MQSLRMQSLVLAAIALLSIAVLAAAEEAAPAEPAPAPAPTEPAPAPAEPTPTEPAPAPAPPPEQAPPEPVPPEPAPIAPPAPPEPPRIEVPPGCTLETDPGGFSRVKCERQCPAIPPESEASCTANGGVARRDRGPEGCEFLRCEFPQGKGSGQFFGPAQCPSDADIDASMQRCGSIGQQGRIRQEGPCRVAVCEAEPRREQREQRRCAEEDPAFRERLEQECAQRNGEVRKGVDPSGCAITLCEGRNDCRREVEKEAVDACDNGGGEFVARRDPSGCVVFADCVRRGDDRQVYYEKVDDVPDATKLLQVAFKLEELIMALDQMRQLSEDLADYWAAQGSPDEGRFRRVAAMFSGIIDDVKAIRSDLKDRLDTLTAKDIEDFKYRIKDISKSRIKEIVYVMLSDSDEVKQLIAERPAGSGCGDDGRCFDDALRLCKPGVSFSPRDGPTITISGLEGADCIVDATMEGGSAAGAVPVAGPLTMRCAFPPAAFAKGMRDKEEFLKHCTGPLADMGKQSIRPAPAPPSREPFPGERPFKDAGGIPGVKQEPRSFREPFPQEPLPRAAVNEPLRKGGP